MLPLSIYFYPQPIRAIGYCHALRCLSIDASVRPFIRLSTCPSRPYYHSTAHNISWILFIFGTAIYLSMGMVPINLLRPRRNRRHFADDIFKYIFLNDKVWILIKISLKFVSKCPINNITALDQIMAWRRPGDKPLSEPRMVSLPTHICVTRPQWVNYGVSMFIFYYDHCFNSGQNTILYQALANGMHG